MTHNVENRGRLQTERRRAIRDAKPKMDQMAAQNMLSMLLRPLMSSTESGLLERGRREYRRREARPQHRPENPGSQAQLGQLQLPRHRSSQVAHQAKSSH